MLVVCMCWIFIMVVLWVLIGCLILLKWFVMVWLYFCVMVECWVGQFGCDISLLLWVLCVICWGVGQSVFSCVMMVFLCRGLVSRFVMLVRNFIWDMVGEVGFCFVCLVQDGRVMLIIFICVLVWCVWIDSVQVCKLLFVVGFVVMFVRVGGGGVNVGFMVKFIIVLGGCLCKCGINVLVRCWMFRCCVFSVFCVLLFSSVFSFGRFFIGKVMEMLMSMFRCGQMVVICLVKLVMFQGLDSFSLIVCMLGLVWVMVFVVFGLFLKMRILLFSCCSSLVRFWLMLWILLVMSMV